MQYPTGNHAYSIAAYSRSLPDIGRHRAVNMADLLIPTFANAQM